MLTYGFGPRMLANMEIALDQACEFLPVGVDKLEARKVVASKIRECAEKGRGTLRDLTTAGRAAAIGLHGLNRAPGPDQAADLGRTAGTQWRAIKITTPAVCPGT
jgi:hypothetical protein